MRYAIAILFATVLICSSARSDELIRGLLSFDPPPSLHQFFAVTNVEVSGLGPLREYHISDYSLEGSLLVDLRKAGSSDDGVFRTDMHARFKAFGRATNIIDLDDITIGGQPAMGVTYQLPDSGRKHTIEFIEIYWVRIAEDRIVEISLYADSPERLKILKQSLQRFKITKKIPKKTLHATPDGAVSSDSAVEIQRPGVPEFWRSP
jgi:hypothetical protein